ncbi:MAG: hypothetical protein JO156_12555 [Solirubrobacterales bacterium]|nr:hypothetical protein [Solirubrobacterales bacterium]
MTSRHRISTAVALALAISAAAAPVSARPIDIKVNGSDVPAGIPSTQASSPASSASPAGQVTTGAPVVRPNPHQQTTQTGPVGPPILPAPGTRAARAAYQQNFGPQSPAAAKQPSLPRNAKFSLAGLPPASTPTMIVRMTGPGSGFDWVDAGIGAAAGFAVSMLALGVVLVVSERRTRRPGRSAATAS